MRYRISVCARVWVFFGILLAFPVMVTAQKRTMREKFVRLDSMLSARYYKIPYDTNYVVRPDGRWTLKFRFNQTGNTFHTKGTINGITSKADLGTTHKTTISLGASYRGLSAAFSLNPAKMKGIYKDYELNLNYFSSRISLDFSYQRSETLSGEIRRDDGIHQMESGDVTMKIVNVAGYYAFNHRKFSFPAAFNQNYIQRRSAGSWLAGISYQGGSIKTSDELKIRKPDAPDVSIKFGHLGIGGGYGYNLVVRKKWLFHLSVLPTFVVYNRNKLTVNDEEREVKHMRFHMIFNERAAIVYNFSKRYFAGATLVMNNSVFDNDAVIINQNKWRARAFFGLRL
ncbi:MAG: DUF4421 family protein [Bacteroidaceae bacterium]|nr:DUF4421 family protein [Bacteroidaceae bacterium]